MVEKDPAVSVYFSVTIGSKELGTFSSCEGLGVEVVLEQREEGGFNGQVWQLPTRLKYTNVKLSRPLGPDTTKIIEWFASMTTGVKRRHGDDRGEERQERGGGDVEPVGRRSRPLDRAEPERGVTEGRDRDHRDRPPRLPAGLREGSDGFQVDRPARRRWRRVGWRPAAEPHPRRPGAVRGEAHRERQRAGCPDRPDPLPVQPEGTVDLEVGEVGRGRTPATPRPQARRSSTVRTPAR